MRRIGQEPCARRSGHHVGQQRRPQRQDVGHARFAGGGARQAHEREQIRRCRAGDVGDRFARRVDLAGATGEFAGALHVPPPYPRSNRDAPVDVDEGGHHVRVVHAAAALAQDLQSGRLRHSAAIRPIRGERVEAVDNRQNPRADRDVLAGDAARVAACRPSSRDGNARSAPPDTGNCTSERMSAPTSTWRFIFSNSASVSLPGLLRMCSGTASFPVSCRSAAASIAFNSSASVMPSAARQTDRVCLHPDHMAVRHVVFRVDRHRERFDRRQVEPIHVGEMTARVRPRVRTRTAASGGTRSAAG